MRQTRRAASSSRSCNSNSIVNTTVTNVSENRDRIEEEADGEADPLGGEEDHVEGLQFLAERDMRSLHRHIPALGRSDVQNSAIRQHYYPEGGWGWVVVLSTFLCNSLTTGLLLSGGMLSIELVAEFPGTSFSAASWVTVTAWCVSLLVSPLIVQLCRTYSIRLIAVIGGLSMNLSFLFASFGHEVHQVFIRKGFIQNYSILLAVSCAAVRDTSSIMVGQYFKMRRDLAEMWSIAGVGIGVLALSLLYFQAVGSLKWRLGLQAIQSVIILAFFLGLFFRPASLYHPQRDAISHIKCQKEKVKGINTKEKMKAKKKNQMLNFSFLRVRKLRLLLVSISLASLGIYTPMFYVVNHQWEEGERVMTEHLSLLQLWLGLSTTSGTLLAGLLTIHQSRHFYCSTRLLIQSAMVGAALAMFSLYCVRGYYGYILSVTLYGLCLGSLLYTTKIYCYNSVKAKDFAHVWSIVMSSQSVSCLAGIMITGYINSTYSKTGYWFSILSVLLGASILSLVNIEEDEGVLHSLPPPSHSSTTKRPGVSYDPEISMNYGSKVDKYLGGPGDLNGNFKGRQVELEAGGVGGVNSRNLSYSDPALLTSSEPLRPSLPSHSHTCSSLWQQHQDVEVEQPESQGQARRWEGREVVVGPHTDSLLIDQITSTV